MKKILRYALLSAVAMFSNAAMAQTTVGATDNTTGYMGAYSEELQLTDGQVATFEFTNYTAGAENYQNWVTCVSNGTTFNAASPLVMLRADNWDNVQGSNAGVTSNYNWDTFKTDMNGAKVVVTVTYRSGNVKIHADITTTTSNTYFEEFTKSGVSGNIVTCLTVDHSYLVLTKAQVTDAPAEVVGAEDNTSAYLGAFSTQSKLTDGQKTTYEFTNYTAGAENYQNWVACVSGATFDAGNLLVALRADNWENVQASNNGITSNYNWDTFKSDMNGSKVVVTFTYQDGAVNIHADITTTNNTKYSEDFTKTGITGDITVCMSVDHSHLVISKVAVENLNGTVIGATDFSTAFWGAHSPNITVGQDKTLHMEFTNYTPGTNNYNNWLLVLTDTNNPATEYLVLRSDNYGWSYPNTLPQYANGTLNHFRKEEIPGMADLTDETAKQNLYWSTFREEMKGAYVILDIKRKGTKMDILAGMVAQNGAIWYESFVNENFVDAAQSIDAHLTVDNCYLVIDDSKTTITDTPDETPTAIKAVKTVNAGSAVRYNMAGQQVGKDYKGLVIENGRKFLNK